MSKKEQSDKNQDGQLEKASGALGLDLFDFPKTWALYLFHQKDLLDRLMDGNFKGMTHPFRFAILPFIIFMAAFWVVEKPNFSHELTKLKSENIDNFRIALPFLPGLLIYHVIRVGRLDSASIAPVFYILACFIGSLGLGFASLGTISFLLQVFGAKWASFDNLFIFFVPYIVLIMIRFPMICKEYYDRLSEKRQLAAFWVAFIVTALLINYLVERGAFKYQ